MGLFANATVAQEKQKIGAATNLPLPRFVSLKAQEAFARRGPGKSHRVDWKFVRRNLPLQVVDEHGHWRKVQDVEGEGGWIHYALLSRAKTILVTQEELVMFAKPRGRSRMVAKLNAGVVGKLNACRDAMCEIEVDAPSGETLEGWVEKSGLWGPID